MPFLFTPSYWLHLISWWSAGTLLLAAILAVVRYPKLPLHLRYLAVLTWGVFALEAAARIAGPIQNLALSLRPLYSVSKVCLFALVYTRVFQRAFLTRLIYGAVMLFAWYLVADTLWLERRAFYWPSQQLIEGSLLLGLVGLYLKKLLDELVVQRLATGPLFLVSAGVLFYVALNGSIALFGNCPAWVTSRESTVVLWPLCSIPDVILVSFCTLAQLLYTTESASTALG